MSDFDDSIVGDGDFIGYAVDGTALGDGGEVGRCFLGWKGLGGHFGERVTGWKGGWGLCEDGKKDIGVEYCCVEE